MIMKGNIFHVLIPPNPFSCRQKNGERSVLPLFAKQRGVGGSSKTDWH